MAVFLVVGSCRLLEVYQRYRAASYLNYRNDDGSKHLWNVD